MQVLSATGRAGGRVVDIVRSRKLDVALLRLDGETPWAEDMRRPVYARIDRTHSGELDNCECIGFPQMQSDPDMGRHTLEYHGVANQTDGADTGRLLIRDERIHPGRIDDSGAGWRHRTSMNLGRAVWCSGVLSGAGHRDRGRAPPPAGRFGLQAIGFDTIAKAGAWDKGTRRIASALGLPPRKHCHWRRPRLRAPAMHVSSASDVPTSPVPSISAATAQTEVQENLRRASARQTLEPARWTGSGSSWVTCLTAVGQPPAATPPTESGRSTSAGLAVTPAARQRQSLNGKVDRLHDRRGKCTEWSLLQAGQALNEGADQLQAQVRQRN